MTGKRFYVGAGLVIGAVGLAGYWWIVLSAITNNMIFAYANYWGAPVGTITVVIVLTVLTPAWFWAVWRYLNNTTRS